MPFDHRLGETDVTADVDFQSLAEAPWAGGGARATPVCHGPMAQGAFLAAMGIAPRVRRLCATLPPGADAAALWAACARLTRQGAGGMGALYRFLAVTVSSTPPYPFSGPVS